MKVSIYRIALNPNQICTILECYKESVFTQLFPERAEQNKQIEQNSTTIPSDDLKALTLNASAKRHFFVIDAVGVTEALKPYPRP